MKNTITFLGTGGGRICSFLQARATGGVLLKIMDKQIHIDPGPGAIVRARQFGINPEKTDIICISHNHTDHTNDLPIIAEAMTSGTLKKKGVIISNKTCVFGHAGFDPVVSTYFKKSVSELFVLKPEGSVHIGDIKITATKTKHDDPFGIGFKFEYKNKTISYVGDTEFFNELAEEHKDTSIMIINVLRPDEDKWPGQLCTADVIKLVKEALPSVAIITHFGMKMLKASPLLEAREIQKQTGIRCVCARDGMRLNIKELIMEGKQKKITHY